MAHTPGPWVVNDFCIEGPGPEGARDVTVAMVTGSTLPRVANAALIAAAPELLASLKQCLPLVDAYRRATAGDGDVSAALARSVIAKAEGRSDD